MFYLRHVGSIVHIALYVCSQQSLCAKALYNQLLLILLHPCMLNINSPNTHSLASSGDYYIDGDIAHTTNPHMITVLECVESLDEDLSFLVLYNHVIDLTLTGATVHAQLG